MTQLTVRVWIETVLGIFSGFLLVLTMMMPDWIERIFGFEPDGGNGSTEWGWAIALAVATLVFFADACRSWSRSAHASASLK